MTGRCGAARGRRGSSVAELAFVGVGLRGYRDRITAIAISVSVVIGALLLPGEICLSGDSDRTDVVETMLAEGGEARQHIVVGPAASEATRAAAAELADYLERISGASFKVNVGDGKTGLAVGVTGDFSDVNHGVKFDLHDPLELRGRWSLYFYVPHGKDPSRRKACRCVVSRDIGMYDSCVYGCPYCYATSSVQ